MERTVDAEVDCPVALERLRDAAIAAARHRGAEHGQLGIRVTDDARIHRLNRDYLGHDYPTDVISFGYTWQPPHVEGELVVSVETARRQAERLGWNPASELMLYVVHGVLHIAGLLDATPQQRATMRASERVVLGELGIDGLERFGADRDAAVSETEPTAVTAPRRGGGVRQEGSA